MSRAQLERVLTAILWGGVAATGEHTMLFLSIIRRIHVRFESDAPVFFVDPGGLIPLTKDMALAAVWLTAVGYGAVFAMAVYLRPRPSRSQWVVFAFLALAVAAVAGLTDLLWGVIALASGLALASTMAWNRASAGQVARAHSGPRQ